MTSPFIQRMRELLDAILQAQEAWERDKAEREMAHFIQQHSKYRAPRETKMDQAGDDQ